MNEDRLCGGSSESGTDAGARLGDCLRVAEQWRTNLRIDATAFNSEWQAYLQKQTLLDIYQSFRDQQADTSGGARTG